MYVHCANGEGDTSSVTASRGIGRDSFPSRGSQEAGQRQEAGQSQESLFAHLLIKADTHKNKYGFRLNSSRTSFRSVIANILTRGKRATFLTSCDRCHWCGNPYSQRPVKISECFNASGGRIATTSLRTGLAMTGLAELSRYPLIEKTMYLWYITPDD